MSIPKKYTGFNESLLLLKYIELRLKELGDFRLLDVFPEGFQRHFIDVDIAVDVMVIDAQDSHTGLVFASAAFIGSSDLFVCHRVGLACPLVG